jgi:hypothetical protein
VTNGQPYIRYHSPGRPDQSTWIPAGKPAPAGHRADREPPAWARWLIVVLIVALSTTAIVAFAAWWGSEMAERSRPTVVTPTPVGAPR